MLSPSNITHRHRPGLLLGTILILIYWYSRVHHLLSFPAFLDEVDHILWARDAYSLHPFTGAQNGKLFGLWWMTLFYLDGDGVLFVVRAATILIQTITIAVMYSLGRYFVSYIGGITAALFYILSPYGLFYDRLALMDPYVVTFAALLTWFAVRHTARWQTHDAVLAGLMLAGAILAKATGVMLVGVPLCAYWLLGRAGWRIRMLGTLWTYAALGLFWVPFYIFLNWRGYHYFGTATQVVGTSETTNLLNRIMNNISGGDGLWTINSLYYSFPLILLGFVVVAIYTWQHWRQGLFLLASLIMPLGGLLAFATKMSTRYFHFHVPFAMLLAAVSLTSFSLLMKRYWRYADIAVPTMILGLWALVFALPFRYQYLQDATRLALPRLDRLEYIQSDAAGYAIPEAAHFFSEEIQTQQVVIHIIGLLANCNALDLYIADTPDITLECPALKLDGSTLPDVMKHINNLAQTLSSDTDLWIVYEESAFTTLDGLESSYNVARIIERPDNMTRLQLLRMMPDD